MWRCASKCIIRSNLDSTCPYMQLRLGKNVSRHARGINSSLSLHAGAAWTVRVPTYRYILDHTCRCGHGQYVSPYESAGLESTYPYMQVRPEQYLSLHTGAAWAVCDPTCRCGLDSMCSYIQVRVHTYRYILNHTCRCSMDSTCHHMKVRAMAWTVRVPIRRYEKSQVGSGDNVSGLSIWNLIDSLYIHVLLSKREYITG